MEFTLATDCDQPRFRRGDPVASLMVDLISETEAGRKRTRTAYGDDMEGDSQIRVPFTHFLEKI